MGLTYLSRYIPLLKFHQRSSKIIKYVFVERNYTSCVGISENPRLFSIQHTYTQYTMFFIMDCRKCRHYNFDIFRRGDNRFLLYGGSLRSPRGAINPVHHTIFFTLNPVSGNEWDIDLSVFLSCIFSVMN